MYINTRELQHLRKLINKLEEKDDVAYIRGIDVNTSQDGRNIFKFYSANDLSSNPIHAAVAVWGEGASRFSRLEDMDISHA